METLPIFPLICVLVVASLHPAVQEETVNLGVIVDSSSWSGKIAKSAIKLAVDDVNSKSQVLNGTRLFVHLREAQTPLETASAVVDLLANKVVALIEAQTSEAEPFVSDLGEAANVPVLSLSVTSPALSNRRFPYFVRMAHDDRIQMKAVEALVKHYGWKSIAFLHSDHDFGCGAMSSFRDALRDLDSEIAYTSMIPSAAQKQTIREELNKLKTTESRVYVVHAPCGLSMNLFMEAKKMGMMEAGYVWITTQEFTSLWDYVLNASTMSSMQGLLGIKTHIPNSKELNDFTERWERQFRLDNPNMKNNELNTYGLLAYDTVLMIARAIGKMEKNTSLSFLKPSSSLGVIAKTKVKVFQQGRKLLQEIFLTNFAGLSGLVKFHEGEMYGCSYEIVNVVGKSYQVVGYWPYNSSVLLKTLPPSLGNEGLPPVIWPGRSVTIPRGWVIPSRLKIAVPRKAGWEEFVCVSFDPETNETRITGFSVDIFRAVVRRLDHQLLYDFIPYPEQNNYSANYSYDELVRQVYLKKYDAVVGDVTITAERSEIVDFTQPYTETGLVMVARTAIKEEVDNAWTFLHPFTPALWATTAAFLIYTGLVVWLLEHRINPAFRGSPMTQMVTVLWFASSSVFYAHQERIRNSLSRIVVVVWLFVAFVLMSSYTANLASRLTAEQITPLINGFGDYKVGYRSTYVGSFLTHHSGIAEVNVDPFSSRKAYEEALSKGAKNGGVDAILDEIPFVRAFLSGRCGYSMVGSTYQSGGFGFVFPKGSFLVQEFSKGILKLSESDEFQKIKAKYFNDSINTCSDTTGNLKKLDVVNFWGLYLVTGIVSSFALIVFFSHALHNFTKDSNSSQQEIGVWKCIKCFAKYVYHEKVPSQFDSLEMQVENENPFNREKNSDKHHKLDVNVKNDTDHNIGVQTSTLNYHPNKFIDEGNMM